MKNIRNLYLLYLYKQVKNPLNIVFIYLFPIIFLLIVYFAYGRDNYYNPVLFGNNFKNINFPTIAVTSPGVYLLAAITITIMSLPSMIGSDRLHKRIKVFKTWKVSKYDYLISIGLVSLTSYVFLLIIMNIIVGGIFRINQISIGSYIGTFFLCIFVFIIMMFLSLLLAQFGNSDRSIVLWSLLFFYPILFLSGSVIPAYVIDRNNQWFKYVQFLSPIGTGTYWSGIINISSIAPVNVDFSKDFLGILIPVVEVIIFTTLAFKFFKWK